MPVVSRRAQEALYPSDRANPRHGGPRYAKVKAMTKAVADSAVARSR